jgi:hypothetical protein
MDPLSWKLPVILPGGEPGLQLRVLVGFRHAGPVGQSEKYDRQRHLIARNPSAERSGRNAIQKSEAKMRSIWIFLVIVIVMGVLAIPAFAPVSDSSRTPVADGDGVCWTGDPTQG